LRDRKNGFAAAVASAAVIAMSAGLAGCAGATSKPVEARFTVSASASLNPDARNQPSPVVLRIYELAARDEFDRATFFELYDHDKDVLGKAALARTVMVVRPGEQLRFTHALDPATRAVAIVAAYQRIDDARWRAVVDIRNTHKHTHALALAAQLDASAVELAEVPGAARKADAGLIVRLVKPVWQALAGTFGSAH
jgi:type VI secretion system protein VasD